jgi:hypothetical protein
LYFVVRFGTRFNNDLTPAQIYTRFVPKTSSEEQNMDGKDKTEVPVEGKKPTEVAASGVVENVKDKMRRVTEGVSHAATKTKDTAQEWASSAADVAGQAKDKAVEIASTAAHKAGDIGQDVTGMIRRHPYPALLIGFGLGFMLGQVMHRSEPTRP